MECDGELCKQAIHACDRWMDGWMDGLDPDLGGNAHLLDAHLLDAHLLDAHLLVAHLLPWTEQSLLHLLHLDVAFDPILLPGFLDHTSHNLLPSGFPLLAVLHGIVQILSRGHSKDSTFL